MVLHFPGAGAGSLCGDAGYNINKLFNRANQQNGATILYRNVRHSASTMSDAEWVSKGV